MLAVLAASWLGACPRDVSAQALPAPVLQPFSGTWHTTSFVIRGEVDHIRFGGFVRLYRNGSVIDSVNTTVDSLFSVRVPLQPGDNEFVAILRDSNFVESPPSNGINVIFDESGGFFMPVPFAPGAAFDVNVDGGANKVELRIFDIMGDLVMRFESRESRTFYSFPWDGMNASGERVHRGPLVAVVAIDHPGGNHEVIRRAFLYDPEASP